MSLTLPAAIRIASRYPAADYTDFPAALLEALSHVYSLPLPGSGHTLERWRCFAHVAAQDLSCAKLFESHADALAIMHELQASALITDQALWAVWCAEPPSHRVRVVKEGDGLRLHGVKAWCSGAHVVEHTLVSAWDEDGIQNLVAVSMKQPGVSVLGQGWQAVGMARTQSVQVQFDSVPVQRVGAPGAYLTRSGFMHGGAGVAACWYGAACAIAQYVIQHVQQRPNDEHAAAHLGAMDISLRQARALLYEAATLIDEQPQLSHTSAVRRARLAVEAAVDTVLYRAPRAVGAAPLCQNAHLAHLLADLPIFVRQSHAERDLACHGQHIASQAEGGAWAL